MNDKIIELFKVKFQKEYNVIMADFPKLKKDIDFAEYSSAFVMAQERVCMEIMQELGIDPNGQTGNFNMIISNTLFVKAITSTSFGEFRAKSHEIFNEAK